ncbi:LysR family transcriptional regulator [Ottowia oryzae]|uniref:HTH lysR-type domain-containing protein n=1 Tax=Ottowia oryzae TaxID=2109914 RepID=A0A2S0MGD7_9BURK|nr:LysR family transcriptional regulator [Ottowia oryzae]AVO34867.1 hypothetical protein C6570_11960 [Ottowia oryzae]
MHIHARAIKYFDMIRRSGSIREAARRLHVASSAVNRQLLQLEEEIGSPLFERMTQGLRLTPAGEVFSRHVITVLQDEVRLRSELDMLRGVRRGSVSVAAVEGVNADLMPTLLTHMHERYPGVRVHLVTCGSAQVAKAVTQGDADVGIGFAIERHEALHQCMLGQFALGAVVPPDHPIGRGCAEFCVNGQSNADASRPVRKHNEHQETQRTRRTAVWPAGQLQDEPPRLSRRPLGLS